MEYETKKDIHSQILEQKDKKDSNANINLETLK
jgi:hypothetical protein